MPFRRPSAPRAVPRSFRSRRLPVARLESPRGCERLRTRSGPAGCGPGAPFSTTERDLVELTVGDQGPGIASNAVTTALDEGRRGIADMMSEAAACGAEVHVQPG